MSKEKDLFIQYVIDTICKNPDWIAELIYAIQGGVAKALHEERSKSSDLAYGFISILRTYQKTVKNNGELISQMINGIGRLKMFFRGTEIDRDLLIPLINKYVEDHPESIINRE